MARHRAGSPIQLGIAILLGYFSIALAFGVAGRELGFTLLVLAGFSVIVFAGASQFLAIQLLTQGVAGVAIVFATFILNARHLVMSLALRDRIEGKKIPRPVLAFGITDEVFASAATRTGPIRDTELLLMEVMAYSGWIAGTVVGYVIGQLLPPVIEEAMGIALYAMFISLIVPGIIRFWRYGIAVALAGGINFGLTSLGLSRGPALLIAIVVPALILAINPRWSEPT